MAYQGIGTGTTPNDNTGDSLLVGALKINSNFEEIYNALYAVEGNLIPSKRYRYIINNSSPISSDYTSPSDDVNKIILVNLSSTTINYTLPLGSSIEVGDWIKLVNVGSINSSSLRIFPQGFDRINGFDFSTENLITTFTPAFNNAMQEISFVWTGDTYGWRIMNGNLDGLSSVSFIQRSLRFNSSDSAYLSRTPSVAGNRRTWTWSGWIKRSSLGVRQTIFDGGGSTSGLVFEFSAADKLDFYTWGGISPGISVLSTPVFRDTAAWFHLLVVFDTTQAFAPNRYKLYVNGLQVSNFDLIGYPTQDIDYPLNSSAVHSIGRRSSSSFHFDGYLADVHFIDGQALDPSSFGFTDANGVWQPKAYTGTYGTNGFHLPFSDNSTAAALGTDTSSNSNTWTVNNISVAAGAGNDSLVDTPTSYGTDTGAGGEVRGNYATFNPLGTTVSGTVNYSNGNLQATDSTAAGCRIGTIAVASGKFYWEFVLSSGSTDSAVGVMKATNSAYVTPYGSPNVGYRATDGNKYVYGSASSYGANWGVNDVIGTALDMDAATVTFYKNGVSQGAISIDASVPHYPYCGDDSSATNITWIANFGQRPFAYTAPSGYKALCTTNLPSTTITTSGSYTGNGVADGPFVYLNGVPTSMTVNGNAVTFGTEADKLSNGFKVRTASTTYNQNAATYNYSITSTGDSFKRARAQSNP